MDVADTRFGGTRARDRDDLAIQVQTVFKKFLEQCPADDEANETFPLDETQDQTMDTSDNVSNDSFSSARTTASRQVAAEQAQQHRSKRQKTARTQAEIGKLAKYAEQALKLLDNERNTLFIDFKDVEMFDPTLANDITCEYYRFYPYLSRAVATYVREEKMRQAEAEIDPNAEVSEKMYVREHVKKYLDGAQIRNKDYYVGFYNYPTRINIRDLSSTKVGQLTRVTGQVVRTHSVHPELIIGCFRCRDCLSIQYTEQQFRYTLPTSCSNENCANRLRFDLVLEKSRFTDFQRLRIQETQQELPRGCIPRSFDVVLRGADQVECIQPGDQCDFIGTLLAIPDIGQMMSGAVGTLVSELGADSGVTGLKSIGVKEMTYSLAFLANACIIEGQIKPLINTDDNFREQAHNGAVLHNVDFTDAEIERIHTMSQDKDLLDNLATSLFSSIYGSDDVKKGIILQLLGGVPKQTETGTKLRGDINICLVGDPSTAKSQFLKIVTDFAPVKAVYASGKASSASGLTAAVVRDTDGGFVIEAGALMLADRGICCIDEFDKMDLKDQVAIHEAMEQQTISITKAGVAATLNARASILAAANPIGSVYDASKDLRSNLSFSLPIMSRFDLFFTLIDPRTEENDQKIGSRILEMHMNYANALTNQQEMKYSFEDIRLYLRFARKYYPKIPIDVEKFFVQEFIRLRTQSTNSKTSWRITIRQLESLIRLSEAIARAHCSETVKPEYVREAARLIEKTIVYVGNQEVDLPGPMKESQNQMEIGEDGDQLDQGTQGHYEGETESQPLEPSQKVSQSVKISITTYKEMAQILMMKLRHEFDDIDRPAMKKSELVDWYLHHIIGELSTETELIKRKQLCERVLLRLIRVDRMIMEIKEDGNIISTEDVDPDEDTDEDRLLILNPELANFEHEDFFNSISQG